MYSIPCRILCWILIFSQLFACKKKIIDLTTPTPPATEFCKQEATPLELTPPDPDITSAPKGDGTNTIIFTLDSNYDESFFSWNICPDGITGDSFDHSNGKPFREDCLLSTNRTTASHILETNLLTVPHGYFYFAACNTKGMCTKIKKFEVGHKPGLNIPTPGDIQKQQDSYSYYIQLATSLHAVLVSGSGKSGSHQMQGLYDILKNLSIPELAEFIQTKEFNDQIKQFATIDQSKLFLADETKETAAASCDFGKVLSAIENTGNQTESETQTNTAVVADTSSTTTTATTQSSGSGGADPKIWIAKGFAIAGALITTLYAGYNYGLAKKKYKFNTDQIKWVEKTYMTNVFSEPTITQAQDQWGEKSKIVTSGKVKWLSPKLSVLRETILDSKNYYGNNLEEKHLLKEESIKGLRESAADLHEPTIKNWGKATIAGFLVLITAVVLSSVLNLSEGNHSASLDSIANEILQMNSQSPKNFQQ